VVVSRAMRPFSWEVGFDVAICAAYFSIPAQILYFASRRFKGGTALLHVLACCVVHACSL
jgi:hypothetical protein